MRDCTRYTINAALHVVTCLVIDSAPEQSDRERTLASDTIKVLAELREAWMDSKAPDMARRNG